MASFFISDLRERTMHNSMYFGFIQPLRGLFFYYLPLPFHLELTIVNIYILHTKTFNEN